MTDKKKLVGVYLPTSLIMRIKEFIFKFYKKHGITKSQSEIIEEAIEQYLDRENKNT